MLAARHHVGAARPGGGLAVPSVTDSDLDTPLDADEALERLYAAHYRGLLRLAVLLVRDRETAEEVVQDAFVAMHGSWGRLRDPARALAYLRQTVLNRARSALRRRGVERRHLPRPGPEPVAGGAGPDAAVLAGERRAQVLDALRALPRRQREVLALRYYADLDETAIAQTLGISRGAVKSHASRGAAALRAHLGDHREEWT
jgi:RNA polymerase sigma-70 factor (sigma-E family)